MGQPPSAALNSRLSPLSKPCRRARQHCGPTGAVLPRRRALPGHGALSQVRCLPLMHSFWWGRDGTQTWRALGGHAQMSALPAGCAASPTRCCLESNHATPAPPALQGHAGCAGAPQRGQRAPAGASQAAAHRAQVSLLLECGGQLSFLRHGQPAPPQASQAACPACTSGCRQAYTVFRWGSCRCNEGQHTPRANPACACTCPSPPAVLHAAWCTCTAGGQPFSIAT